MADPQTIVLIPTDTTEPVRIETLPPARHPDHLREMQAFVGGYIQLVPACTFDGRSLEAYVNEEGIMDRLPPNPRATRVVSPAVLLPVGGNILGPMIVTQISGRKITPETAQELIDWLAT